MKKVDNRKSQISPISAKIPIHPGFPCFFMVLSATNHSKRFVCSLRFVRNILYIVWNTTLCVKLEKHRKSSAKSTQKRIQITVHRDSCSALPVLGNSNASFARFPLGRLNELQRSSFRRQFLLESTTFHKGVRQPVGSFGFVTLPLHLSIVLHLRRRRTNMFNNYTFWQRNSSSYFESTHLGAPPAPAGLVLVTELLLRTSF